MNEIWKSIKDFSRYEISNYGNIRNLNTANILKPKTTPFGYKRIGLKK